MFKPFFEANQNQTRFKFPKNDNLKQIVYFINII